MTTRGGLKALGRGLASILVMPALASYWLRSYILGADRALEGSTQALALWPGLPGQYLRRAFLACVLEYCAPSATIEFGTIFSQVGARIAENAYIGPHCHIGLAHIERGALIAASVHIPSGAHTHGISEVAAPIREQERQRIPVRIGEGSWVGSAAVVMADVGRDTVVGAGAVVTKNLPDNVVAGGVPARVIRQRFDQAPRPV